MIRITRNLGMAIAMLLLAPLSAHALAVEIAGVSSSGASLTTLLPGETITFDLRLTNAPGDAVYGLSVGARGYDADANGVVDDGLSFVNGDVAASAFNPVSIGGGLANQLSTATEFGFFNPITFARQEKRAMLFDGIGTAPTAVGDGSQDTGIAGLLVGDGDVHFRVTFEATPNPFQANTDFTLDFGTLPDLNQIAVGDGGVSLPFYNDSYTLTVVPEPGTALLMGLGLLGLSTQRRR